VARFNRAHGDAEKNRHAYGEFDQRPAAAVRWTCIVPTSEKHHAGLPT
jgi:hypothetical protein